MRRRLFVLPAARDDIAAAAKIGTTPVVRATNWACIRTSTTRSRPGKHFAGTLFQPSMHVQYGLDGRVFFSSVAAQIPTSVRYSG